MSATYEIPLQATPQTLSVSLNGATYNLTVLWRAPLGEGDTGWVLDIADSGGKPIIQGIPLVTGADLMAQYAYLGLGFSLYVQSDFDPTAAPTYDNLGQTAHLYAVF